MSRLTYLQSEPALGEGEQGPLPGPRACGGPAGHQRGAPHHAKTPRGGASARGNGHSRVFDYSNEKENN